MRLINGKMGQIMRPTLWLRKLSLLYASLDCAIELSVERCTLRDVFIVCENVFLKGRATVQKGWVSKKSIKITRPQW